MDEVIEYYFDNVHDFYAELDEILRQQCSNDRDIERIVTHYIRFLSRYLDRFTQATASAFYKFLDSPLCLENSTTVLSLVLKHALEAEPPNTFVPYGIIVYAGRDEPRWMEYVAMDSVRDRKSRLLRKIMQEVSTISLPNGQLLSYEMELLFEICKVQRMEHLDLIAVSPNVLNHLLDMLELASRGVADECFIYNIIQVILVFNEQFMMAQECNNRVLDVLVGRMNTSASLGSNLIFMLNRTGDLCLVVLILKFLYGVFMREELFEYFYTNDLHVLVDIILRQVLNLGDERGALALRDSYLRVLNPLLTNSQLRLTPYKATEIYRMLLDVSNPYSKAPSETTKRLVARILQSWWQPRLDVDVYSTPMPSATNSPLLGSTMAVSVTPATKTTRPRGNGHHLEVPPLYSA